MKTNFDVFKERAITCNSEMELVGLITSTQVAIELYLRNNYPGHTDDYYKNPALFDMEEFFKQKSEQ